jgi:hypothetical protein
MMLLGCVLPLALILLLPLLGIRTGVALFMAVIAIFACHVLMVRSFARRDGTEQRRKTTLREGSPHVPA